MLTKVIEFSIRNKLTVGILIIALVGYGAYEVKRLPIDAVPDITNNQVQIITSAPSLGAPDVERLITFPIEQVNNNIPGLQELRSISRFGLSVVTIVFEDDIDIYWARQQVSERISQAKDMIPDGAGSPTLAPVTTGLGEIYQYSLRAAEGYEEKYNAMELRTIQDWIVRRQLLGVKGVAEVSSFGGLLKQYEVAVDPSVLKANNITINDVFEALRKSNQNTGGAYIEKAETALFIRSEGLVGGFEDLNNTVVKTLPNGIPLLIRDVAEVRFGHATRYGALTYNGEHQVSGAVVMMLKGENSNEVIAKIKERIEQIKKTLPEGVVIDAFLDRTKMVNNAIGTVSTNLLEGALIVVFVLVLFLGNFRAGILVASVIPLSMLFAIIMMNLFGVSGNLMSLGALDFGLIVDGAVIIVEAVMYRLYHHRQFAKVTRLSQEKMDQEVEYSATRMMNSAVFGQIIILIVYLPILTLQGIEGKMFKPMAQTVAFSLLGAFILSLTYIPMMSTLMLSKTISHKQTLSDRIMVRLENLYERLMIKLLNIPKTLIVFVLVLFAASLFVMSRLGGEFIPALPEGDYAVETRVLPGSNLTTSIEAVSKASKLLLKNFPEIEKIVTKSGNSEVPVDPMPMEASDMILTLKDRKDWTSAETYEALEAKMGETLRVIPGVTFSFQFPVAMRFNELISGARQDVVCKIFGEDLDSLARYANGLARLCNSIQGTNALYVEAISGMPQIVIKFNRSAIAQYGLSVSDINRVVNAAFAGENSGVVYEREKRFDLVVRLAGDKRADPSDVASLLISTPAGEQIPLSLLASVNIVDGPIQVQREDSQRRIIVGFNIRGRDVQSIVEELQQKVERNLKLAPGYYITYGGAFENLEAAKGRLYIAVPVSLVLIFILLYFAFGSVRLGLLIYTAIPLSSIGGIFALALRNMPFSISAGIGFIALFGVAVLNGIVLITEFKRLRDHGANDLKKLVLQGTKTRLRPVLMTASVASLGFLPMALSHGEGAEVQRPLATVVIGGLLVATFLTLCLLPILYVMFQKKLNPPRARKVPALFIFAVFSLIHSNTSAQSTITLRAAIDTAAKNNLLMKNERLKVDYRQKLISSATHIPSTDVMIENGQINSKFSDTRLGLTQSISFPKVYTATKDLLTEEWKKNIVNVDLKELELRKEVSLAYFKLIYLDQKKQLLNRNDSLYGEFLKKTALRFKAGESSILEKITAEYQSGQIGLQLSQIGQDIELSVLEFQVLLNTSDVYRPIETTARLNPSISTDTAFLFTHPQLKLLKQEGEVTRAETEAERSKLLPSVNLGYNIMSMRGIGADNQEYSRTLGFHSLQVGLGIPLFRSAQKAKIDASKLNSVISETNYEAHLKILKAAYRSFILEYTKSQEVLNYYENIALKHATEINSTASLKFSNGEINYLEWVMLMNQSVSIESEYLAALHRRNNAIIEINSLVNQERENENN